MDPFVGSHRGNRTAPATLSQLLAMTSVSRGPTLQSVAAGILIGLAGVKLLFSFVWTLVFLGPLFSILSVLLAVTVLFVACDLPGPRLRRVSWVLALAAALFLLGLIPRTDLFRIRLADSSLFDGMPAEIAARLMGNNCSVVDSRCHDLGPAGEAEDRHDFSFLGDFERSELLVTYDAHDRVRWTGFLRDHGNLAPVAFDAVEFPTADGLRRIAMAHDLDASRILIGMSPAEVEALIGAPVRRVRFIENHEDDFPGSKPMFVPLDEDGRVRHTR